MQAARHRGHGGSEVGRVSAGRGGRLSTFCGGRNAHKILISKDCTQIPDTDSCAVKGRKHC